MERKCIKCIHFVCTREECSAENTEVCKENYISKGGIDLYIFGKYEVECDEFEIETIADIFKDMYLGVVGTTEEELKEALEREGFDVKEVEG